MTYYEIVSVSSDGKERVLKACDGFIEAFFELMVMKAICPCALVAFDRDDNSVFRISFC